MSNIQIRTPSLEAQMKIHQIMKTVRNQKKKAYKCPHCHHNSIFVYQDARAHIGRKCALCGTEVVVDLASSKSQRGFRAR